MYGIRQTPDEHNMVHYTYDTVNIVNERISLPVAVIQHVTYIQDRYVPDDYGGYKKIPGYEKKEDDVKGTADEVIHAIENYIKTFKQLTPDEIVKQYNHDMRHNRQDDIY